MSLDPCTSAWGQHLGVSSGNQRGWTSWTSMTPALRERQRPCYRWALVRSGGEPSGTLGDKARTAAEALSPGHGWPSPGLLQPASKEGSCRAESRRAEWRWEVGELGPHSQEGFTASSVWLPHSRAPPVLSCSYDTARSI